MSRSENRHQRARVIANRIRAIKDRWLRRWDRLTPGWIQREARMKTNPFTACSCEGCQNSREHRETIRRERKAARQAARMEGGM